MELYFYTAQKDVAATSLADLALIIAALNSTSTNPSIVMSNGQTIARLMRKIESLVQSDTGEPLIFHFYADATTVAPWSIDPTYSLVVGLGRQDPETADTYAATMAFTIVGDSRVGQLQLNTTALRDALVADAVISSASALASNCPRSAVPETAPGAHLVLHVRKVHVVDAVDITETVALLPVIVEAGVLTTEPVESPVGPIGPVGEVLSVNGRTGNVVLVKADVGLPLADDTPDSAKPVSTAQAAALAFKAPIASPTFTGTPAAPTPTVGDSTNKLATTAFVATAIGAIPPGGAVSSVAGRTGDVVLTRADVGLSAVTNNAQLKASDLDTDVTLAANSDVKIPSQKAVKAYADALALAGGAVSSVNGRAGAVVLTSADVGHANVDNTSDANKPVSTAQATALAQKAPLASPALTGTPTAPTAAPGDNTTKISTTAFVTAAISAGAAGAVTSVAGRTGAVVLGKVDVGLSLAEDTADLAKPISTATAGALALKASIATLNVHGVVPQGLVDSDTVGDAANWAAIQAEFPTGVVAHVLLPEGRFRHANTIVMAPGSTFNGQSGAHGEIGTTLQHTGSGIAITCEGGLGWGGPSPGGVLTNYDGGAVRNIRIIGTSASAGAIQFTDIDGFIVENCSIEYFTTGFGIMGRNKDSYCENFIGRNNKTTACKYHIYPHIEPTIASQPGIPISDLIRFANRSHANWSITDHFYTLATDGETVLKVDDWGQWYGGTTRIKGGSAHTSTTFVDKCVLFDLGANAWAIDQMFQFYHENAATTPMFTRLKMGANSRFSGLGFWAAAEVAGMSGLVGATNPIDDIDPTATFYEGPNGELRLNRAGPAMLSVGEPHVRTKLMGSNGTVPICYFAGGTVEVSVSYYGGTPSAKRHMMRFLICATPGGNPTTLRNPLVVLDDEYTAAGAVFANPHLRITNGWNVVLHLDVIDASTDGFCEVTTVIQRFNNSGSPVELGLRKPVMGHPPMTGITLLSTPIIPARTLQAGTIFSETEPVLLNGQDWFDITSGIIWKWIVTESGGSLVDFSGDVLPEEISDVEIAAGTEPELRSVSPLKLKTFVTTWAPGGGAPSAHAASHAAGGSDALTLTEAQVTNLTTDLAAKVAGNGAITGATKTKITYDAKGLVTAGADATTADFADSTNKRFVSDAQLTVIGNTSGTNSGDQTNISGNAATVTTNANLTGAVTSTGNTAALGSFTIAQLNTAISDANVPTSRVGVVREIWIGAGAMTPSAVNGAATGSYAPAGADGATFDVFDFDDTTSESVQFAIALPSTWNLSTLKAKFYWTSISGSGTVIWGVAAGAASDDDALGAILGTQITVTDTLLASDDLHATPATAAVTVGGTPALDDMVLFKVARDISDTKTGDARLLGLKLQYTESATEPAAW